MKLRFITMVGAVLGLAVLISASLLVPLSQHAQNYGKFNDSSLTTANTTILNNSISLYSNLYVRNLVIANNATLNTKGWEIFSTGNITNYGTIVTGRSEVADFSQSYGGSGGGSLDSTLEINNGSGYNTLSPGGTGGNRTSFGQNGNTPPAPTMTSALISKWNASGFENFLSGASGEKISYYLDGYTFNSTRVAKGANGLYIQADSFYNYGIINATGSGSTGNQNIGYTGGGGGGVILLSYHDNLVTGNIMVSGGKRSAPQFGTFLQSGAGGKGQVLKYKYSNSPPLSLANKSLFHYYTPPWAVKGNYVNYTFTGIDGSNSSLDYHGFYKVRILNVYSAFGSVFYDERYFGLVPNEKKDVTHNGTSLYTSIPTYVPCFESRSVMGYFANSTVPPEWNSTPFTIYSNVTIQTLNFKSTEISAYIVNTSETYPAGKGKNNHFNTTGEIDTSNGIFLNYSSRSTNSSYSLLSAFYDQLNSTNINLAAVKSTAVNNSLFPIILVAVSVVVIAILLVYRSNRIRSGKPAEDEVVESGVNSISTEARIKELDSLLKKGVISREYYEWSIQLLKRKP